MAAPQAITDALREILVDPDEETYTDDRLNEALRLNREQVFYRNPYTLAEGTASATWYRNKLRVPPSDIDYSLLCAEPGGLSFQALPAVRYWDSSATAKVWVAGDEQTTGYSINYLDGRITFDTALEDWQPVHASFCYYKVFHAARQCLMTAKATGTSPVRLKQGPVDIEYGSIRDAIVALNGIIRDMQPKTIIADRKIY